MSDHWDEFNRRAHAWRRAGDTERLRLVELHQESYRYRETNPEHKLELLTQARDEARRLRAVVGSLLRTQSAQYADGRPA